METEAKLVRLPERAKTGQLSRRDFIQRAGMLAGGLAFPLLLPGCTTPSTDPVPKKGRSGESSRTGGATALSQILGRPTDRSIALSVLSSVDSEAYVEFGITQKEYRQKTATVSGKAGAPYVIELEGLEANWQYFYRLCSRQSGQTEFRAGPECSFHTQRSPGSTFTFALQGDSHPEREGKMYHPDLYMRTMRNVAEDRPDFYLTMGDDFSIESLISKKTLSQSNVDLVYAHQRTFLGMVGASSPLFLVNGNHEQAGRHWLDGTVNNPAVLAGQARTRFYPLPEPSTFYGGDSEKVELIGLLRDYYSWTWGDALFVVIDPYWHSPVGVDDKDRDPWEITLGETQYRWLTKTLTGSAARFKFVFAHHVLGTGRGGVELAHQYEWGGKDKSGSYVFPEKRPGWDLPIHALMAQTGVTIFFQGHDHLFARQELDGVIYQSMPNPADHTYQAFNREAYRSGDILPNSGHLRVTVSPEAVKVDYVRSFLPKDETAERKNGEAAFTYTIPAAPKAGI